MVQKKLYINDFKYHRVSEVICLKCLNRWISVRPVGTKLVDLECIDCGQGYVIETGESLE